MAIGFPPKFIYDYPLEDNKQAHFLVIALQAAKDLGWEITYSSPKGFKAHAVRHGIFDRNAEVSMTMEYGVANLKSASLGFMQRDGNSNKKNIRQFIARLEQIKAGYTEEALEEEYHTLSGSFSGPGETLHYQPPPTLNDKIRNFFFLFLPHKGYFITPIIIDINILVFLLMLKSGVSFFSPDIPDLIQWGANFKPLTLNGGWWRLFTSMFLHIGFFHLLMNMYALIFIGILLEPHIGRFRFLVAYLFTGLVSSLTSLYWHDLTVSAGASGAIFGMYGVFLALLTTNFLEKKMQKTFLASIIIFVLYNLANGMKAGIDNAAHLGGLLSGLIMGYAFYPSLLKPENARLKYLSAGILCFIIALSSFVIYYKMPDDILKYEKGMESFARLESDALNALQFPPDATKENILNRIQKQGIVLWENNIQLLQKLEQLHLPAKLHERDKMLLHYCRLRKDIYHLFYREVKDEDFEEYKTQIDEYRLQVQSILNQIKSGNDAPQAP
jgi:rhomboid protease GluP